MNNEGTPFAVDAAAADVAQTQTPTPTQTKFETTVESVEPRRLLKTASSEREAKHIESELQKAFPDKQYLVRPESGRFSIFVIGKLNGPELDQLTGVAIDAVGTLPRV